MPPKIKFYKKTTREGVGYIVYDCSIEDREERCKEAMTFSTATAVAAYLGISRTAIPQYTSRMAIAAKKRFTSKKQGGKEFSIRLSK